MYARITPFRMKPGSRDEVAQILHQVRGQILALPGMHHFFSVMNDTGHGYMVAVVESKEISEANMHKVREVWAHFADLLDEHPMAEGFEVLADWAPEHA